MVRRPSDAPYTAAARPAGPAPTTTTSYSAPAGSVPTPSSSATRRSCGRTTVLPPTTRIVGRSAAPGRGPPPGLAAADGERGRGGARGQRPAPIVGRVRCVGGQPAERDLVAVEEA